MLLKTVIAAGLVVACSAAARAEGTSLDQAGIPALDVPGFAASVPAGMPLFAALPQMAPGAEVNVRGIDTSGLVAFGSSVPSAIDPNADIATGSLAK
ncbi:hypothetical protein [Methylobacterium platani]|uniref:Uncharacterized protein n=2 Tax=Methylobacterium platani TaxID=427683 RepID=A0A179S5C2_9HYPH|nr:hypothetical protein [Methylobacterium platani]KMO17126.1 hypothetical protein SQ03_13330 [Methylobacterium platani JCM 14648]OAS21484.1 hypothetical protein A5481_20930 [Methylobacterium platani]